MPPEIWNINTELCDVSGQTNYSGGWLLFSGQTKYSGGWLLFSGQTNFSGGWLLFSGQTKYSGGWILFSGQTNYSSGWLLFSTKLNMFLSLRYIQYISCLSSCFVVCLYPINVKTAEPIWPKFWLRPNMALGKVYVELHKIVLTFSIFVRFWKSTLKNCKSVIEKLK